MTIPEQAVQAMPERIYAKTHGASTDVISGQRGLIGGWNEHKRDGQTEFVRSDLIAAYQATALEQAAQIAERPVIGFSDGAVEASRKIASSIRALTAAAPHLAAVRVNVDEIVQPLEDIHAPGGLCRWTDVETAIGEVRRALSALEPSAGRAAVLEEARRKAFVEGFEDAIAQADNAINRHDDTSKQEALNSIRALTPDFRALHPVADKPSDDGAQRERAIVRELQKARGEYMISDFVIAKRILAVLSTPPSSEVA